MSGVSALSCAELRELAPELALGILSGAERAEAVLHVNGCTRCQARVAELTAAADAIPQLVPEVEPPPGFEARVMRRLGEGERRSRRRWITAVAVAAAAAVIMSITVVRVIESDQGVQSAAGPVTTSTGLAPVAVPMRGGTGDTRGGWAYVSDHHGVAIALDYGLPSGTYSVTVTPAGEPRSAIGTVSVVNGYASWTGHSARALQPGTRIALVDASGAEVCHGTVPTSE